MHLPQSTSRARMLLIASAALVFLSTPSQSSAQLSRLNATVRLFQTGVLLGNDVAYDPVNNVYLVVGGQGAIYGIFTDTAGNPITSVFELKDGLPPFEHYPRVEYSPDVSNGAGGLGGFLVTWHQDDVLAVNVVHGRVVAYPNRFVTPDVAISDMSAGHTKWTAGAAIAYSASSRRFLVVWQTVDNAIQGRFVGTDGLPIGGVMPIANPGGARDPGVAWNAWTNEFGISYTGWDCCGAFAGFVRLRASDGFLSGRALLGHSAGTYMSDIDFNSATGRFVMAWTNAPGTNRAEIDGGSNILGAGLVSSAVGGYDSLGLAFNPVSGTLLAAGQGQSTEILAVELAGNGVPLTGATTVTAGAAQGSFYPRVAARTTAREWNISFSQNLNTLADQVVGTGSTGGTVPPPSPPPPPPSGCTTPQPGPGWTCVNGGWLPPSGGGTSSGGCTTPQPGAGWTCVNGGWLPPSGGGTSSGGCTTPQPGAGWTCVNGGWLPPSGGGTSSGGCTTPQPGAGWTCVNGGWLPPSGGGTSSGGCTTPQPGAGWTCVNGGWLPPSGGGSSCTTVQPGVGWTCVNGGWLPPSGGGSSCTTVQPGAGWTCVNGGWLPPSGGGSCTTVQPGAGWICVNGGWLPSGGGTSCTTPQPGAGWTCANGGWLPPSASLTSSCTTPSPGSGWVCVNGGWLPPDTVNTCSTPDPFVAIGGGVCINGGWVPRQ